MNKINYACGDALSAITAYSCAEDFGNRIDVLFLGKDGQDYGFTGVSGEDSGIAPSVSELQSAMSATGDDKIVAIRHITNGVREKGNSTELSGMDTETGGSEEFDVYYNINGSIKALNNDVIEKTQEYSQLNTARLWFVTNKGYIFGGLDGYKVSTKGKFTLPLFDGTKTRIDFSLSFNGDDAKDNAVQDNQYLTIDNGS